MWGEASTHCCCTMWLEGFTDRSLDHDTNIMETERWDDCESNLWRKENTLQRAIFGRFHFLGFSSICHNRHACSDIFFMFYFEVPCTLIVKEFPLCIFLTIFETASSIERHNWTLCLFVFIDCPKCTADALLFLPSCLKLAYWPFKAIFHHSNIIHSVSTHLYADVRMGEDLQFTKQSWSFSRKQPCS